MGILRLLLALSVVAVHSGNILGAHLVGGQVAVESFYIISGFYMSLVLNEKYVDQNNSYYLFISNRLLKLYPIYWTIVFITITLSIGSFFLSHGSFAGKLHSYFEYGQQYGYHEILPAFIFMVFTNLFLVGQDVVMFLGIDTATGHLFFTQNFATTNPQLSSFLLVPQAWTLGIEIAFYLIAPFIVRKNLWVLLTIAFLSLSLRLFLTSIGLEFDPWSYRFFPNEILFFIVGALAYKIYVPLKGKTTAEWMPILSLIIVTSLVVFYENIRLPYKTLIYYPLFAGTIPIIFNATRSWKWDYFLGELSYPVYISHMLIYYLLIPLGLQKVEYVGNLLAVLSIGFSILLNLYIVKPIEKFRQRRLG